MSSRVIVELQACGYPLPVYETHEDVHPDQEIIEHLQMLPGRWGLAGTDLEIVGWALVRTGFGDRMVQRIVGVINGGGGRMYLVDETAPDFHGYEPVADS